MKVNGQCQGAASWSMEKEPRYPLNLRLDGPQRRSGRVFEKMKSLSPAGIRAPDRWARLQSLYGLCYLVSSRYRTMLSGLQSLYGLCYLVSSRYTDYVISSPRPKFKVIYKHRYLKTVCDTLNSSRTFGTTSLHINFTSFFLTNCPLTIRFRSTQHLAWPIYRQLNYSGRGREGAILSKYMSC
jgi:hypothetical protein